ncbi:unnamed protein product, partial [Amoebophrya sp. A120]|eukprot:GSA120T00019898001.1
MIKDISGAADESNYMAGDDVARRQCYVKTAGHHVENSRCLVGKKGELLVPEKRKADGGGPQETKINMIMPTEDKKADEQELQRESAPSPASSENSVRSEKEGGGRQDITTLARKTKNGETTNTSLNLNNGGRLKISYESQSQLTETQLFVLQNLLEAHRENNFHQSPLDNDGLTLETLKAVEQTHYFPFVKVRNPLSKFILGIDMQRAKFLEFLKLVETFPLGKRTSSSGSSSSARTAGASKSTVDVKDKKNLPGGQQLLEGDLDSNSYVDKLNDFLCFDNPEYETVFLTKTPSLDGKTMSASRPSGLWQDVVLAILNGRQVHPNVNPKTKAALANNNTAAAEQSAQGAMNPSSKRANKMASSSKTGAVRLVGGASTSSTKVNNGTTSSNTPSNTTALAGAAGTAPSSAPMVAATTIGGAGRDNFFSKQLSTNLLQIYEGGGCQPSWLDFCGGANTRLLSVFEADPGILRYSLNLPDKPGLYRKVLYNLKAEKPGRTPAFYHSDGAFHPVGNDAKLCARGDLLMEKQCDLLERQGGKIVWKRKTLVSPPRPAGATVVSSSALSLKRTSIISPGNDEKKADQVLFGKSVSKYGGTSNVGKGHAPPAATTTGTTTNSTGGGSTSIPIEDLKPPPPPRAARAAPPPPPNAVQVAEGIEKNKERLELEKSKKEAIFGDRDTLLVKNKSSASSSAATGSSKNKSAPPPVPSGKMTSAAGPKTKARAPAPPPPPPSKKRKVDQNAVVIGQRPRKPSQQRHEGSTSRGKSYASAALSPLDAEALERSVASSALTSFDDTNAAVVEMEIDQSEDFLDIKGPAATTDGDGDAIMGEASGLRAGRSDAHWVRPGAISSEIANGTTASTSSGGGDSASASDHTGAADA